LLLLIQQRRYTSFQTACACTIKYEWQKAKCRRGVYVARIWDHQSSLNFDYHHRCRSLTRHVLEVSYHCTWPCCMLQLDLNCKGRNAPSVWLHHAYCSPSGCSWDSKTRIPPLVLAGTKLPSQ